jgi:hypothetical protein
MMTIRPTCRRHAARVLVFLTVAFVTFSTAWQAHAQTGCSGNTALNIGSGVYDITGPAAELGMMGYAMVDQKTSGIHT